jgi:hypothetical protein
MVGAIINAGEKKIPDAIGMVDRLLAAINHMQGNGTFQIPLFKNSSALVGFFEEIFRGLSPTSDLPPEQNPWAFAPYFSCTGPVNFFLQLWDPNSGECLAQEMSMERRLEVIQERLRIQCHKVQSLETAFPDFTVPFTNIETRIEEDGKVSLVAGKIVQEEALATAAGEFAAHGGAFTGWDNFMVSDGGRAKTEFKNLSSGSLIVQTDNCTASFPVRTAEVSATYISVRGKGGCQKLKVIAILDSEGYLHLARTKRADGPEQMAGGDEAEQNTPKFRRVSPWVRMVPSSFGDSEEAKIARTLESLWFVKSTEEETAEKTVAEPQFGPDPYKFS